LNLVFFIKNSDKLCWLVKLVVQIYIKNKSKARTFLIKGAEVIHTHPLIQSPPHH